jgi:hypothetical protein
VQPKYYEWENQSMQKVFSIFVCCAILSCCAPAFAGQKDRTSADSPAPAQTAPQAASPGPPQSSSQTSLPPVAQTSAPGNPEYATLKDRLVKAEATSELLQVKFKRPIAINGRLSTRREPAIGKVSSISPGCVLFEYQDDFRNGQMECIPYQGIESVKRYSKTLHTLKKAGQTSLVVAVVVVATPFLIVASVVSVISGHGIGFIEE